jgi:hypothetical protein
MLSPAQLKKLAGLEPGEHVLSVHCRTDPRDPSNRGQAPGWLVALRNGFRDLAASLSEGTREDRLALRSLIAELETRISHLDGSQRGRSLAWFVTPSGAFDRWLTLQLPLQGDVVVWDPRPFISPLVEVVDRGQSTGIVLVGGERVRLLHWEQGIIEEPDRSTFDLELGDWRRYEAYAPANPAMAQQTATNRASFDRRVEEWRERFFETAARETAGRLEEIGWERILLAAEGQVASAFAASLPASVRARLVAELDLNVVDQPPAAVAAQIEPRLEEAWRRDAVQLVETAAARAKGGGAASLGIEETVWALGEHRVEHLLLDPRAVAEAHQGPGAREFLRGASPQLLAERSVEAAILSGARVTSLADGQSAALAEAVGMAALLRY